MQSRQLQASDPRDLLANFVREGLGLQGEEDFSLTFSRAFKDSVAYLSNGLKLKDICKVITKYFTACKNMKMPKWKKQEIDTLIKDIKNSELKDAELDHWLTDSETSATIHIETKSWPQNQ